MHDVGVILFEPAAEQLGDTLRGPERLHDDLDGLTELRHKLVTQDLVAFATTFEPVAGVIAITEEEDSHGGKVLGFQPAI
jgi:hypothetical protein